jgi:ketol-acid reductoisomerase
MARFFSEGDIDTSLILSQRVAIIGYGNQGHAHALNLKDRGVDVVVGSRSDSENRPKAEAKGLTVTAHAEAVRAVDVVMLTLPDVAMAGIYKENVAPHLRSGQLLLFAHGFNLLYNLLEIPADIDVGLVSPKGAGAVIRREFLAKRGVAALVAVHQEATGTALARTLSYAWGIGALPGAILETTVKEETETDLFGEQAVLCGGIPQLLTTAFETLIAAGYQPEAAYFECIHEAKLITDLIYERGMAGMREAISDTAQWGGLTAGPNVIGEKSSTAMKRILERIQTGDFSQEWMAEHQSGGQALSALKGLEKEHTLEDVARDIRRRLNL